MKWYYLQQNCNSNYTMHRLQVYRNEYNIIYTYYDNTANILNILIVPRELLHEYRYLLDILVSPYFIHVYVDCQQIFAYIVSIRPQALTDHIPVSRMSQGNTEAQQVKEKEKNRYVSKGGRESDVSLLKTRARRTENV